MPLFDFEAFLQQFLYREDDPLLFNSGFFVFFFAAFIGLYYTFRNRYRTRRYIFIFFSLYFFYKASGFFVGLVILSAIVDYWLSNAIWRQQRKWAKNALLLVSIIFNLGLLFYFKYTDFFIAMSNDLANTHFNPLNLLLPIGISFYTFENLSYTIDVYRGQFEPARRFSDYLLFLSFFPKLMMGPIVRAHDFVPQINKPYSLNETDFAKGFYLIISGLIKKLVISDYISLNYVDYIFDDPARYTGLENLFAVYGYAVVIYCDFSGYSDIAIGIARWLGFHIPVNFLSPYQSASITEFWRRWHISLSSWLRDYLYIPLGGNRSGSFATWLFAVAFFAGVFLVGWQLLHWSIALAAGVSAGFLLLFLLPGIIRRDGKVVSANMNLLTTMLLGGFWHGANWNFIIWGVWHGLGLALHKIWLLATGRVLGKWHSKPFYRFIGILVTFHFVCAGWVFFRSADFDPATNDIQKALSMLYQIFYSMDLSVWPAFAGNYWPVLLMMGFAYLLHALPDSLADKMIGRFTRIPMIAYIVCFFGFVILYGYFKAAEPVMPIYLKF
jgi:D-alanyl-lipoteichoic acid acyltransferase DltB (MBOAT superfamily)